MPTTLELFLHAAPIDAIESEEVFEANMQSSATTQQVVARHQSQRLQKPTRLAQLPTVQQQLRLITPQITPSLGRTVVQTRTTTQVCRRASTP